MQNRWSIWLSFEAGSTAVLPKNAFNNVQKHLGGSPGLVILGGDPCPEGCGFESQHWKLVDGYFSNIFVLKIDVFV